jgi:hypothetical protein
MIVARLAPDKNETKPGALNNPAARGLDLALLEGAPSEYNVFEATAGVFRSSGARTSWPSCSINGCLIKEGLEAARSGARLEHGEARAQRERSDIELAI